MLPTESLYSPIVYTEFNNKNTNIKDGYNSLIPD